MNESRVTAVTRATDRKREGRDNVFFNLPEESLTFAKYILANFQRTTLTLLERCSFRRTNTHTEF